MWSIAFFAVFSPQIKAEHCDLLNYFLLFPECYDNLVFIRIDVHLLEETFHMAESKEWDGITYHSRSFSTLKSEYKPPLSRLEWNGHGHKFYLSNLITKPLFSPRRSLPHRLLRRSCVCLGFHISSAWTS